MPDIGGLEFLVIAVVALIVLGPKDLTKLFRSLGQFTGKVRGMAKEFGRAMNEAADDAGVSDLKRDLRDLSNPKKMGLDAVNKAFEGMDPTKYPEGSESRKIAEKKVAQSEATAQRIADIQRDAGRKGRGCSGRTGRAGPGSTGARADPAPRHR